MSTDQGPDLHQHVEVAADLETGDDLVAENDDDLAAENDLDDFKMAFERLLNKLMRKGDGSTLAKICGIQHVHHV